MRVQRVSQRSLRFYQRGLRFYQRSLRFVRVVALAAGCLVPQLASAQGAGHEFLQTPPPSDGVFEAPEVNPGTIWVEVRDGSDQPLSGVQVRLEELFDSVSEGKREGGHQAVTDERGVASFPGLSTSLRTSFTPVVEYQGGEYSMEPFRASEKVGLRAVLHVYPATSDLNQTFVGMRGFVYVTLRESAIHFEVLYRVFNMSRTAWVPEGVSIRLPRGASAFTLKPGSTRFEEGPQSLVLRGTFPPGQRDVLAQFQLPGQNNENEVFSLGVLPHVAELRVLAEAAPGLSLNVPGFEPVQKADGPTGSPVWITRRIMNAGDGDLGTVVIELSGLPVVGPERYYALAVALALALSGVYFALRYRRDQASRKDERARIEAAKKVLLSELELLEKARRDELVGPQTYESTKRQLLDALARLALREA